MVHDWITCNGVQPLEIESYMPVVLDLQDYAMAIGKVATIELIKIRMKRQAERIRMKKTTPNLMELPTVEEDTDGLRDSMEVKRTPVAVANLLSQQKNDKQALYQPPKIFNITAATAAF